MHRFSPMELAISLNGNVIHEGLYQLHLPFKGSAMLKLKAVHCFIISNAIKYAKRALVNMMPARNFLFHVTTPSLCLTNNPCGASLDEVIGT